MIDIIISKANALLQGGLGKLRQDPTLALLAGLGGIWTTYQVLKLCAFVHLHFFHRSRLERYRGTREHTWALISGASDGIGRGFAEELCSRGFNVIIHGRNEAKLEKVKDSLLQRWPQSEVEIFVLDAVTGAQDPSALDAAAHRFQHHDIRILVNNVASVPTPLYATLHARSVSDISASLNGSALFPTLLTRAFLPSLIHKHPNHPALILNLGSASSELPTPYLADYSGVKAYNKVWSEALRAELFAESHRHIEVLHFLVGEVVTASPPGREVSLAKPGARSFARACLGKVGCGSRVVWGWWVHQVLLDGVLGMLPEGVRMRLMVTILKAEKGELEALVAKEE